MFDELGGKLFFFSTVTNYIFFIYMNSHLAQNRENLGAFSKCLYLMVKGIFLVYVEIMQAFWHIELVQVKAIQHLDSFIRDKSGKSLFY